MPSSALEEGALTSCLWRLPSTHFQEMCFWSVERIKCGVLGYPGLLHLVAPLAAGLAGAGAGFGASRLGLTCAFTQAPGESWLLCCRAFLCSGPRWGETLPVCAAGQWAPQCSAQQVALTAPCRSLGGGSSCAPQSDCPAPQPFCASAVRVSNRVKLPCLLAVSRKAWQLSTALRHLESGDGFLPALEQSRSEQSAGVPQARPAGGRNDTFGPECGGDHER